jgi:O-antigen ligase
VGLWALAVIQLIPLPEALHRVVAPGSAGVWHPDVAAAAAVLGPGPHPISLYPEATRRWLAFATGVIALALAAAPAFRDHRLLLRASTAVVGGAVLVAVYGFVARLAFGDKLYGVWSVPTVAPFGPFVSKNHFAGYVELAALLAIGLATGLTDEARQGPGWLSWIASRRARWVVIAWGAALVLVLAVPVSLSRGGVVSLCGGLLVFAGLRLWTRGPSRLSATGLALSLVLALLATLAIGAALPAEARSRILTLTGVTSDQSGSYRIGVWRDTIRLVGSSPVVGCGFGSYADALAPYKTTAGHLGIEHAENDLLEFLAEGGCLAALLGAVAMVALFFGSLKSLGTEEHGLARTLVAAALAGCTSTYVHSAFDFNLRIPSNALVSTAIAALALATMRRSSSNHVVCLFAASLTGLGLAVVLLTPWTGFYLESGPLLRAVPREAHVLRRADLEQDLSSWLRRRPADAPAWVALAWLRAGTSPCNAHSLGSWAVRLDPMSTGLRAAAEHFQ